MTPFCRTRFATPLLLLVLNACTETGLEPPVVEQIPAPEYAALSVGADHACALDVEGRAFCWGGNGRGQLGEGSTTIREEPTPVRGGHRYASIEAGAERTCGITEQGALFCWGGGRNLPVPLGPEGTAWDAVSTSAYGICALDVDARAFCTDPAGQLVEVPFGLRWASIGVGASHVCGVTTSAAGYCWGNNADRQLGYEPGPWWTEQPVLAPGGHRWLELVAGSRFTCGLTVDETTLCWGIGEHMILGTDTIPEPDVWLGVPDPIAIAGGNLAIRDLAPAVSSWRRLASCGMTEFSGRRTAVCWGDGSNVMNVGFGRFDWQTVQLGDYRACGLTTDGRIYCWEPRTVEDGPFDRIWALLYPDLDPTEIPSPAREWRDS